VRPSCPEWKACPTSLGYAARVAGAQQGTPTTSPSGVAGQDFPQQGPPSQSFTDPSQLFSGRAGAFHAQYGYELGEPLLSHFQRPFSYG